jgi:large subunit ribosomal protein L4
MAEKKLTVDVYSQAGEKVSTLGLDANIFNVETNNQVMFDAVQVYQANLRQATAKTKTRAEVSGGGKKPWRQKGTGRARAGSSRSPIWVGGGISSGPEGTQNYKLNQNRKAHNLALRSALTLKAKEGLIVVDSIKVEGKTKEVETMLTALKATKKVLIVTSDEGLSQACSNLAYVITRKANNVSVYDLLNANFVIIDQANIKGIEEAVA